MSEDAKISGIAIDPLPDGWKPLGVVAMIKCLDETGADAWAFRTTDALSDEEVLGALTIRVELAKAWLLNAYTSGDD